MLNNLNNSAPTLPKVPPNIAALPQPLETEVTSDFAPLWYYYFTEEQRNVGPISLIDFEKEKNNIDGLTWVWRYGFKEWKRLGDCDQLREFMKNIFGDGSADDNLYMNVDETLLTSTINDKESAAKQDEKANNIQSNGGVDREKKLKNVQSRKDYRVRQKIKKMEQNNSSIYISGLNVDKVTIENLIDLFKGAGQIMLNNELNPIVKLYRNASDNSLKGDGLITYKDPMSKDLAIKYYDGRIFLDQTLCVSAAQFNYTEQATRKRGPALSKKELLEAKKKRQLVEAELTRRQADDDELAALFIESAAGQKTFGVVIKSLWLPENALEWKFTDPVYDLIGETLLLTLSRKSLTKDLIWGGWSDIKKVTLIKGHRDGIAIVYLRDRHSAEALVDAITNCELPWGPIKLDKNHIKCPLPSNDFRNREFEIEKIRAEHTIVTAYAHISGTDYSSQIVNENTTESSISLNPQWKTFITNCKDTLLPRKGGQVIPFPQCIQEEGIDPLIRLQRRLYCYNNSIPLIMDLLKSTNNSPDKGIKNNEEYKSAASTTSATLTAAEQHCHKVVERKNEPKEHIEQKILSNLTEVSNGFSIPEEDLNNLNNFMDEVEAESSDEEFRIMTE